MSTKSLWLAVTAAAGLLALPLGYVLAVTVNSDDSLNISSFGSPASGQSASEPAPLPIAPVPPDITGVTRAPGVWEWWQLRGGECLDTLPDTLTDPVTVVSCDLAHRALYLRPVVVSLPTDAPFPGIEELEVMAREHCGTLSPDDLGNLRDDDDLVVLSLAPLSPELWERGPRVIGCVVARETGEPFSQDLVGPGGVGGAESPSP